jgi:hypothetical protein
VHADAGDIEAGMLDVCGEFLALYILNGFCSYERLTGCVSSTFISVLGVPNPTMLEPKLSQHKLSPHKLTRHKFTRHNIPKHNIPKHNMHRHSMHKSNMGKHKDWLLATGPSPLPTIIRPPSLGRTSPLNLQITTAAPAWADGHAGSEDALGVAAVTIAAKRAR